MAHEVMPRDCWVRSLDVLGIRSGRQTWRGPDARLYQWDELHGEIEVYDRRGNHRGVMRHDDPDRYVKEAKQGRRIDV